MTQLPRHWFDRSPLKTHFLNALNFVLYYGEFYMTRMVSGAVRSVDDAKITSQVQWFVRQEVEHAAGHRQLWQVLERDGIDFARFARVCRWFGESFLPRALSQKLNLGMSTAIEHMTAVFAEVAFRNDLFHTMHPEARKLFVWHAQEELEHKTVVFDVLLRVSSRAYFFRVIGMGCAVVLLGGLLSIGTLSLVLQDRASWRPSIFRQAIELLFTKEALLRRGFRRWVDFFDPTFHPAKINNICARP